MRTRVQSPGEETHSRSRLRAVEIRQLYLHKITDVLELVQHAEDYRVDYNTVRLHEALVWISPLEVHLGTADLSTPNFPEPKILPTS